MVRLLCDADGNREVYSLCCLCKNLIAIRPLNSDLNAGFKVYVAETGMQQGDSACIEAIRRITANNLLESPSAIICKNNNGSNEILYFGGPNNAYCRFILFSYYRKAVYLKQNDQISVENFS